MDDLARVALKTCFVYFAFLLVVRILGRREIGNVSAFDFVVALMLGELADEMIFGDVTLLQGSVAIAVVGGLEALNSWISYKSPRAERWLSGSARLVVRDGEIVERTLRRERMSHEELYSLLRSRGVDRDELGEVRAARLEPDGELSVQRYDWAKSPRRTDLVGPSESPPDRRERRGAR
jgi:uncharacterized membrane protein YcaP (DUF421 family)